MFAPDRIRGEGLDAMQEADLKRMIREVPGFPRPGINFYDLTPVFRDPRAFRAVVLRLVERFKDEQPDAIAGIEARGLIVASAMAHELEVGLVLLRKPGKLPWETEAEEYALEYGTGKLEVHRDAITRGERVLVVDDLLATGGTAAAAGRLVERLGGLVLAYAFLVELAFLGGRKVLEPASVFSLIQYP